MPFLEDRDDYVLGRHWSWSHQRICQVNSSQHRMRVMDGSIWFRTKRTKYRGIDWVKVEDVGEEHMAPVVKMVLITRFPDAIATLDRSYREVSREGKT